MRVVRALNKETGRFEKMLGAGDIDSSSRYAFTYACRDPGCTQRYHWRTGYRAKENRVQIPATFVENRSSDHRPGCRWDFEKIASGHRDVSFSQNGEFHVRINFPLGGAPQDVYLPSARITKAYFKNSIDDSQSHDGPSYPSIGSMSALVKFLEDAFGSLEAPQMDDLKLHYQGRVYSWSEHFAASDRYEHIIDVPLDAVNKLTESRLAVVQVLHETSQNANGKRRFACAAQDAHVQGKLRQVQPSIVCSDDVAVMIDQMIEWNMDTALVAARPFTNAAQKTKPWARAAVPVALYVKDVAQFSSISQEAYWRPRPSEQQDFDF